MTVATVHVNLRQIRRGGSGSTAWFHLLSRDLRQSLNGLDDILKQLLRHSIRAERFRKQVAIDIDRGQRVIEVVADAVAARIV